MDLTINLPWTSPVLAQLAAVRAAMPHALLIHGPAGIGKRHLATLLARALLCEHDDAQRLSGGCSTCASCLWFGQRNHPDFRHVTTEALALEAGLAQADDATEVAPEPKTKRAPSREIKVDQVRALQAFLGIGTHRAGFRVVLIEPLEAINDVGANALLKMLEEPPPRTVFIGVADNIGRIVPTILSRCQKVPVTMPGASEAAAWLTAQGLSNATDALAAAGGAPLRALSAAVDADASATRNQLLDFLARPTTDAALGQADAFARVAAAPVVTWMQQWLADCLSMRLAGRIRYHPAHSKAIAALTSDIGPERLVAMNQRLASTRLTVDHPLNQRLMFESLLLAYSDALKRPATAPTR